MAEGNKYIHVFCTSMLISTHTHTHTHTHHWLSVTSSQPDKWLSLQQSLPLSKLVYLDVGPFHQFLRLEFSVPDSCFTFLLRDKAKCRECLTRLSSETLLAVMVLHCPCVNGSSLMTPKTHLEIPMACKGLKVILMDIVLASWPLYKYRACVS